MFIRKETTNLNLDQLQASLANEFPQFRCRQVGMGPFRGIVVGQGWLNGVGVRIRKNGLIVNSAMPSFGSTFLLGCLAALGLLPGLLYAVVVSTTSRPLVREVTKYLWPDD